MKGRHAALSEDAVTSKNKGKSQQASLWRTGYLPRAMDEGARFSVYDGRYGNTILEFRHLHSVRIHFHSALGK